MRDSQILHDIKEYFNITEFVDKETFEKFGDRAWMFMDIRLLETILFIRRKLDRKITINTWLWGGKFSQRGLRTNICSMVKKKTNLNRLYLSAHVLGKGIDFDVEGMTADEVRSRLVQKAQELPHPIRLERKFVSTGQSISWVHLDVYITDKKVYLFDV